MTALHLECNVRKSFGTFDVIKGVDLEIRTQASSWFSLALRAAENQRCCDLIAGLEDITSGTLAFR